MIQDLHSHTYYSFCGADSPEAVVEAAAENGIELIGITDHNYGIGHQRTDVYFSTAEEIKNDYERTLVRYFDHINLVKEKYEAKYNGKIKVLRGIEIGTVKQNRVPLPDGADISIFDYCLIEHIDHIENSSTGGDLFNFAKRCACPAGIAHTDMFSFIEKIGEDPLKYFSKMAEENIFWEMNVNLDTIHSGRIHGYMVRFFEDEKQQEIIRKSGVRLSVGFDGHRLYDYKPDRIKEYCKKITEMGIKLAFEE